MRLPADFPAPPPVGIGWRHAHYQQVLQERPPLDFLEVHSENFFAPGGASRAVLEAGRAHCDISLHGVGLSLGAAQGLDPWHLAQLKQLVRQIEPVRVSDHAAFARAPLGGQTVHAADLLPLPFTHAALLVLIDNVQQAQDALQRPLAIENLSACFQWRDAEMDEPTFLNQLATRSGCQLLVDVNNVFVNARNAQYRGENADPVAAAQRWIDQIHPAHVAELHLAGHADLGDIVIDDHGSRVSEPVWALYAHAQRRFANAPTLIEWDTGVPDLAVLLDEARLARLRACESLTPQSAAPLTPAVTA